MIIRGKKFYNKETNRLFRLRKFDTDNPRYPDRCNAQNTYGLTPDVLIKEDTLNRIFHFYTSNSLLDDCIAFYRNDTFLSIKPFAPSITRKEIYYLDKILGTITLSIDKLLNNPMLLIKELQPKGLNLNISNIAIIEYDHDVDLDKIKKNGLEYTFIRDYSMIEKVYIASYQVDEEIQVNTDDAMTSEELDKFTKPLKLATNKK